MTELQGFNIADIIAVVIILIGIVVGFKQGLSSQMAFIFTGVTVWAALSWGLTPCQNWLTTHHGMPADLSRMASLIILVVGPILVVLLIHTLLRFLFKITFTTWLDRIGGAFGGALAAAAVAAVIIMVVNILPSETAPVKACRQSWISREVIGVETQLVAKLSSEVGSGENMIEKARATRAARREKWEQ